jgi:glutaredoxin
MKMQLTLYTRDECGLCEVAKNLLNQAGCRYDTVNIETDLGLIQRYGERIPVLVDAQSGQTLFWPFGRDEIEALNH